jgi:hypothetical protein
MFDQTVWLSPKVTTYVVVCEECADDHGFLAAQVEGRLDLEREQGFAVCPRGHVIRIERGNRASVGVV